MKDAQAIEIPDGVTLPEGYRVASGVSFSPEVEGDTYCRLVNADGTRCRARRMRSYSVCAGHGGRGLASDPAAAQRKSKEVRARFKARRQLLGIPPSGKANPRQLARIKALERAEELADALIGPLDDPGLGSVARQLAAARVVDLTFPLAEATIEVELPSDPESMSWSAMKELASRLALEETGNDEPQ